MVKKIFFSILFFLGFAPTFSFAQEAVMDEAAIEAYEDQLDVQASEMITASRRGRHERDRGADVAIGVIGAIADVIADEAGGPDGRRRRGGHGRGEDGWPGDRGREGRGGWSDDDWGGWGPQQIQCAASNGRRVFVEKGFRESRVKRRVMGICYEYSRYCEFMGCRPVRRR